MEAERRSKLYFSGAERNVNLNFVNLSGTWFNGFFRSITENCDLRELPSRLGKVCLIVFNYDRCIEHVLLCAFRTYYGVTHEEAGKLLARIEIHHPYGDVGVVDGNRGFVQFGGSPNPHQLVKLSKRIRTFAEGTHPNVDTGRIRRCVSESERIVFMGFAFHRINMNVLRSRDKRDVSEHSTHVYASAYGISNSDLSIIDDQLRGMFGRGSHINTSQVTCNDLMSEFWLGLLFD